MASYSNPNALVTTQWVADHLGDPNVRLIEVDVDTNLYGDEGHIEGALAWNWTSQLQDQVRRDILSKAQIEALLGQSGVKPGDTIVLYGDNNNWFAAYAYWQLQIYGVPNVKLMNGGRKAWVLEKRPLTKADPKVTPTKVSVQEPNLDLRARQRYVEETLGKLPLVDVRSPAEFSGEVIAPPGMTETAQRGGHVPGAKNVPWSKAVNEDGTFKSADELHKLYVDEAGVKPGSEVIAYCRIGERSSHTWFVLKELLGFAKARNYDGSWTEWGSMVGVPIEK
ncbi:MAG TPA: sulfurtransferase [Limnochordia bacterium]|nr:sulfurtransferase [Limnochordia bacterium]